MAQAILQRLKQDGIDLQTISKDWVLKDELSFDVKRKLASYIYQYGNSQVVMSSGAPEKILENSSKILLGGEETPLTDNLRNEIFRCDRADGAFRRASSWLLATTDYQPILQRTRKILKRDIVFVGIIGFIDPPRREVKGAIKTCQEAGIKVIMITGDHPETARTIASQVGINSANVLTGVEIAKMTDANLKEALKHTFVFARVTPEDKLRLGEAAQRER